MGRLQSQMEDIMGYPTGADPSIIDPTTGKPYDDSSRMRQQAEITRQADAMEAFQSDENRVKLPKLLEEKITPLFNKPEIKFSAQDLEKQYKDYNPEFGKANELDKYGMKRYVADRSSFLAEPKLNTYNTSLIDTIIDAGFLLRNEAQGVTNEKSLLSNFDKIKDRPAVIGFLKEALGPGPYGEGFDINKASWCAAFVNHILGIAGFDQLKYGANKSEESYNKTRANAYLKYGTPVDSLEDAKEGDIIIWDLKPDNSDAGTHVTFYAGDRYGKQGVGDSVDIVGGNHGVRQSVSLKGAGSKDVYVKKNIRGIVRVTKNNITQDFVNELADIDPIFKPFTELNKKGNPVPLVSLRPQLRPKKFNEGGVVTNLERQMEEELGLYPRSKYIFSPVQDSANLLDKEIAEAEAAGISQEPPTASDIADTVIDFTPVIGDIKGAVEGAEVIFEELAKDDPNFLLIGVIGGAGVVGLIPGVGDAAQKLIIKGARRFKKTELNPEVMDVLTPKDQETVEALTKSTLSTPETDGEKLADEVAAMLREGKAGDITEEMLETAGNDFHTRLTQNYIDGNVGMDLPMDWESTMARAADQGLTETRYHGSPTKDIPYFRGRSDKIHKNATSLPGQSTGMFNTNDPFKAFSYEGKGGETYSLIMRPLPENTPRVDVKGAGWGNLDHAPSRDSNRSLLEVLSNPIEAIRNPPPMVNLGTKRDNQRIDEYLNDGKANLSTDMFMRKADTLGYPGATIENVVDRGPSTPIRFSKEEGIEVRKMGLRPSETQARTDTTGIRSIGARFDPRLTGLKNINMAQGGLTSMNEQTQMAFALGGEAETVDPVSGNDVPPGSLPEEVRDDIDAKLSEGEYVVPADVVRFFGVKLFEDLRMQAKIGLQQMDADGRIGGEPVQEQPQVLNDSMDVAELKAALSKSGMYAGGLAKGDTIDSFIDDASRDPMVNGRMRANGATVKMAVGGLVPTGTYGDVNKVDGLIKQLMTAANKDPNLMKRLASKGITLNKTGADQDANEMKKTNRPKTPIKASAGTYINYSNNYEDYNTLGAKMFMDANIGDPKALINSTLLSEKGEITQITLIAPDGTEIPVAWNTSMPIPPGFSVKGEEPEVNDPDKPKGLAERDDGAEQRAQDAIQDNAIQAERFNYSIATPEELYDKLRGANTARNIAAVAGTLVGPVGMVISAAASFNNAIVTRRIEIELKDRIEKGEIDPKTGLGNAKGEVKTVADLMSVVNTDPDTPTPSQGFFKDFFKDLLGKPFDKMADDIAKKGVLSDADFFGTGITPTPASGTTKTKNQFNKQMQLNAPMGQVYNPTTRTYESDESFSDEERYKGLGTTVTTDDGSFRSFDEEQTKAAQEAGVVGSFNKMPSRPSSFDKQVEAEKDMRPDNVDDGSDPFGGSGDLVSADNSGNKVEYDADYYNKGGLVPLPEANKKQNKKRKTQRRKGLGTRP